MDAVAAGLISAVCIWLLSFLRSAFQALLFLASEYELRPVLHWAPLAFLRNETD
jgi:hypothetical protein